MQIPLIGLHMQWQYDKCFLSWRRGFHIQLIHSWIGLLFFSRMHFIWLLPQIRPVCWLISMMVIFSAVPSSLLVSSKSSPNVRYNCRDLIDVTISQSQLVCLALVSIWHYTISGSIDDHTIAITMLAFVDGYLFFWHIIGFPHWCYYDWLPFQPRLDVVVNNTVFHRDVVHIGILIIMRTFPFPSFSFPYYVERCSMIWWYVECQLLGAFTSHDSWVVGLVVW